MVTRHLLEQIELLKAHLELGEPDPSFIERHAMTIIEMAKDLPTADPRLQYMRLLTAFEHRAA